MATDLKSACACGVLGFSLLVTCLLSPPIEPSAKTSKNETDIVAAASPSVQDLDETEKLAQQIEETSVTDPGGGLAGFARLLEERPGGLAENEKLFSQRLVKVGRYEARALQTENQPAQDQAAQRKNLPAGDEAAQAENQKAEGEAAQAENQVAEGEATQAETEPEGEASAQSEDQTAENETAQTESQITEDETAQMESKATEGETTQAESQTAEDETTQPESQTAEDEETQEEVQETESPETEEESEQPEEPSKPSAENESEVSQDVQEVTGNSVSLDDIASYSMAGAAAVMQEGKEAREAIEAAKPPVVVPNVDKALNMREEASEEAPIVGKLYRGAAGSLLEENNGWLKIQSGEVAGWVSAEYVTIGDEAQQLLEELNPHVVTIDADKLNVREKDSTESEILAEAYRGETFVAIEVGEEWVKIFYTPDVTGYVSKEYVALEERAGEAVDTETLSGYREIAKLKESERKARLKKKQLATVTRTPTLANADDATLLAALCQYEAGGSYEGSLAVANVVLNRVRSGHYPNSIAEVIYSPGQFGAVRSGALNPYLGGAIGGNARRAANDALAGVNNIGGFTSFCSARIANPAAYSSYTIVGGNCFYAR